MVKRTLDFFAALVGLIVLMPLLFVVSILIWLYDFHSPFYFASRVGRNGRDFRMWKFRSMVVNADKMGGSSTAGNDKRITPIGSVVREYKLDEFLQLVNVFIGDMSLVGPRPQIRAGGTDLYTEAEKRLLSVRPGITDLASIVFADEGDILSGWDNPDVAYNQIVRPWKSRLALFQIAQSSLWLDCRVVLLTFLNIADRPAALHSICRILAQAGTEPELVRTASRSDPPSAYPPPGASTIFCP